MVAVAETFSTPHTAGDHVVLAAGEEASGLAHITGQYLDQLLADSPEKRAEAARLRGRLGIRAHEGDVAVTLVFGNGAIAIEEGLRAPNAVISGPVETLLNVLAGRENPALAFAHWGTGLRIGGRNPAFGYRAYRLMRLPGVHVWSGIPPQVVAAVGLAGAVMLLMWSRRRGRQRALGGKHG